jgi:hypothetical protein
MFCGHTPATKNGFPFSSSSKCRLLARTLSFGIKPAIPSLALPTGAANSGGIPPLTAWAKGAVRIPGADNNEAD